MKNIIDMLIKRAELSEWNVDNDREYVTFSQYSPAGQDFSLTIWLEDTENELEKAELFIEAIYSYYNSYDPSEEAYLWLDETGHGKNGAPYEMIDVYNDMVECEGMILSLYNELHDYYYEEIYTEED